ncbi:hypothetical protein [Bradyrhizobium sp. 1(2017)]|uniref:hypothetical protein n=1 Tax=Bradyrhizobium sp. 1(2017) TaxID=1404888 RepID=UPI00140F1742|nr:hypothetical protein [Bradyrhizobium sp. 1(2017)]QIO37019.1 hypothetical protein HAP40_37075 [Bradyrhizobium sp. 1(2017)]
MFASQSEHELSFVAVIQITRSSKRLDGRPGGFSETRSRALTEGPAASRAGLHGMEVAKAVDGIFLAEASSLNPGCSQCRILADR